MMVARQFDEGRLVRLAEAPWPQDFAYYLVYPETASASLKRAAFRDWLLAEAVTTGGSRIPRALEISNARLSKQSEKAP
jgi:DNA-binding transcriptional LysR family regulator